MIVSATELKSNLGKYLELAARQDSCITRNGRNIARLTSPAIDKLAVLDNLVGIIPAQDAAAEEAAREERLAGQ